MARAHLEDTDITSSEGEAPMYIGGGLVALILLVLLLVYVF